MMLQKTALRLYKALKGNQLLKRLGGAWHSPNVNDLPLPAPSRASLKTTLRSLAARVPANGPRVDPFPELLPGAPSWNGRVQIVHKQKEWDYGLVTNTLTAVCQEGTTINIYCSGVLLNRGRPDGKQIGATSAVLYQEGRERHHVERVFGETVTEQNIMLRSLHSGLDTLISLLDGHPAHQHKLITIALVSGAALKKAPDASLYGDQAESIKLLGRLSELLDKYPNANITFLWLPKKSPFVGFRRTRQLALEKVRTADLTDISEPQTISNQLKQAKSTAITA
jgi:hypothetical protein